MFVLPYYFDLDLITKDEVTTFANSMLQFQGCSRSRGIPPQWGKGQRCRGAENVSRSLERQTRGFSFSSSDSITNFIFTHSSYGYHCENCLLLCYYWVFWGLLTCFDGLTCHASAITHLDGPVPLWPVNPRSPAESFPFQSRTTCLSRPFNDQMHLIIHCWSAQKPASACWLTPNSMLLCLL